MNPTTDVPSAPIVSIILIAVAPLALMLCLHQAAADLLADAPVQADHIVSLGTTVPPAAQIDHRVSVL
jgi:hypothetical protein